MRAVFWKELRELLLAMTAGLALATGFGLAMGYKAHHEVAMTLIVLLGVEGFALGLWQSFYDRAAAADEFLRHRPVAAARIHVARSMAGLSALALVIGATFAVMCYVSYRKGFDFHGNPIPGWSRQPWWDDLTRPRIAFAVLFAAAMWAVARLGGAAARPLVAVFLVPVLLLAFVLLVGRTGGVLWPTVIAIAAAVVAAVLGAANAVERRSTRRS